VHLPSIPDLAWTAKSLTRASFSAIKDSKVLSEVGSTSIGQEVESVIELLQQLIEVKAVSARSWLLSKAQVDPDVKAWLHFCTLTSYSLAHCVLVLMVGWKVFPGLSCTYTEFGPTTEAGTCETRKATTTATTSFGPGSLIFDGRLVGKIVQRMNEGKESDSTPTPP